MIRWQISHALATRAENVSGDWHDLRECVNLASTRWINAIIGQTWRGENPFKARKAKQGPWLIHLANLRVMYECQGTLVRRGRGECVLAQWAGCMCIFIFFFGRGSSCEDALWLQSSLLETLFLLSSPPPPRAVSADKTNGAWTWKWQKDALSALSGREAGLLCKWGGETWLWSTGRRSEYQHALPCRELNQVLSSSPLPAS